MEEMHVIDWKEAQVMDSHPHYTQRCTLEAWHIRSERNNLNGDVGPLPSTYNPHLFFLLIPLQSLLPTIYHTLKLWTINITQLHIQLSPLLCRPQHYLPSHPRHFHTYKNVLSLYTDHHHWWRPLDWGWNIWSIDKIQLFNSTPGSEVPKILPWSISLVTQVTKHTQYLSQVTSEIQWIPQQSSTGLNKWQWQLLQLSMPILHAPRTVLSTIHSS